MCGRIVWRFDPVMQQWIKDWLDDEAAYDEAAAEPAVAEDRYNIAPTSDIAVATAHDGHRIEVARWGFPLHGRPVFNTRIETAMTSPMWRGPIRTGRCIVPVTGFYEWQRRGQQRQPFFAARRDGRPMLLAGVIAQRAGRWHCSIVTCPAGQDMADIHDRMPVILDDAAWLAEDLDPGGLVDLAAPKDSVLRIRPVSTRVNDARHEGPDLVRPLPRLDDAA